jgi:hypothetical protein
MIDFNPATGINIFLSAKRNTFDKEALDLALWRLRKQAVSAWAEMSLQA